MMSATPIRAAVAAICIAALSLPLPAFAKSQGTAGMKRRQPTPLRSTSAATRQQQADAAYKACIDLPSPDGTPYGCEQWLRVQPAAKTGRHRS